MKVIYMSKSREIIENFIDDIYDNANMIKTLSLEDIEFIGVDINVVKNSMPENVDFVKDNMGMMLIKKFTLLNNSDSTRLYVELSMNDSYTIESCYVKLISITTTSYELALVYDNSKDSKLMNKICGVIDLDVMSKLLIDYIQSDNDIRTKLVKQRDNVRMNNNRIIIENYIDDINSGKIDTLTIENVGINKDNVNELSEDFNNNRL